MDNLAEQLYRAFVSASGLVAGSGDVPNWASMPAAQREVWQAVASTARDRLVDNRLVLMSDGPLDETVKRAAVVIDVDGHVIKNRYGAITKPADAGTTPIDEMLANLVVELHALERDGLATNGQRLETLIGKAHALALCVTDTRWRLLSLEKAVIRHA
jgi:hypothetical protein